MKVNRLFVQQFRNLTEVEICPGAGANVIWGDNAQGKTNLLEAIWLFCGARSFRGAKEKEMILHDADFAKLHLDFFAAGRDQNADLVFGNDQKKILLNEIPQKRISEFAGRFCVVVFSPDQLMMVKQGPEGRRRFLDTALAQILPNYAKALENYERILRQRSHLLRKGASISQLEDMLEVWDEHLVQYGSYITDLRARYTLRLAGFAQQVYDGISSGRESFALSYRSAAVEDVLPDNREGWREAFGQALRQSRQEDLRAGHTSVGPHRDDLLIEIAGSNARSFASQGQQRSAVLALKLAECSLLAESVGEEPVVLLDDVMSELDEGRRSYLLNHLSERQVFLTCCDPSAFQGLEEGKVFRMQDGMVSEQ